jgi:hypothetical protein
VKSLNPISNIVCSASSVYHRRLTISGSVRCFASNWEFAQPNYCPCQLSIAVLRSVLRIQTIWSGSGSCFSLWYGTDPDPAFQFDTDASVSYGTGSLSVCPGGPNKKACFVNFPFQLIFLCSLSSLRIRILEHSGTDPDLGTFRNGSGSATLPQMIPSSCLLCSISTADVKIAPVPVPTLSI